ncbi:hypothetical protein J2T57_001276 [Natronocella acetinitrilica]|uniref:Uncharacterized protein n=1 Tax=Natronocella acetinitrilica TaxID=414046 RepID=A0AAE3G345_9GAMM|nr:hypothetical protein [Natronocella acetinitrilica]MCP1674174.1 hypothetical protein [Natronocella acetinitrilica]
MTEQAGDKRKVIAEVFNVQFGVGGEVSDSYEAVRCEDGRYRIMNREGKTRLMAPGDAFADGSKLEVTPLGHLRMGESIVLVGEALRRDWRARKVRDGYLVMPPRGAGKAFRVQVSAQSEARAERVSAGRGEILRLHPGGEGVVVEERERKTRMVAFTGDIPFAYRDPMTRDDATCHLAYFECEEGPEAATRKEGFVGLFYPAEGQRPAMFKEVGADGVALTTARFFAADNGRSISAWLRPVTIAREELALRAAREALHAEVARLSKRAENTALSEDERRRGNEAKRSAAAIDERLDGYGRLFWQHAFFNLGEGLECFQRRERGPARRRSGQSEALAASA